MYGFWRLGLSPAPCAGAVCVANGDATATSRNAKNEATAPSTGTVHATTSGARRRLSRTAAPAYAQSTSSHKSSEPSCPPQNAETEYARESLVDVWSATYENEKSWRTSAPSSTSDATTVETNAASRAFAAE